MTFADKTNAPRSSSHFDSFLADLESASLLVDPVRFRGKTSPLMVLGIGAIAYAYSFVAALATYALTSGTSTVTTETTGPLVWLLFLLWFSGLATALIGSLILAFYFGMQILVSGSRMAAAALAGWLSGGTLQYLRIGPFLVRRWNGRTSIALHNSQAAFPYSNLAFSWADHRRPNFQRVLVSTLIAMVLSPIPILLVCGPFVIMAGRGAFAGTDYSWFFAAWVFLPVGTFLVALLQWVSDIVNALRLLIKHDQRQFTLLLTSMQIELANGTRPGALCESEVEDMRQLCGSIPAHLAVLGQTLLYFHEIDAGRFDRARAELEQVNRTIESLSRLRRDPVLFTVNVDVFDFAAIQATLHPQSLTDPLAWLDRAETLTVVPCSTRLCAEAAVLLHYGTPGEALERVQHARSAMSRETSLANTTLIPEYLGAIEVAANRRQSASVSGV